MFRARRANRIKILVWDGSGLVLVSAVPTVDPSDPALADTVDRLRLDLPSSAQVGGAAVENLDLKTQLDDSTPLVIAVVLLLAVGVVVNMTPLRTSQWWTESVGAGVSTAALRGLKPVLPDEFAQYLPG